MQKEDAQHGCHLKTEDACCVAACWPTIVFMAEPIRLKAESLIMPSDEGTVASLPGDIVDGLAGEIVMSVPGFGLGILETGLLLAEGGVNVLWMAAPRRVRPLCAAAAVRLIGAGSAGGVAEGTVAPPQTSAQAFQPPELGTYFCEHAAAHCD